MKIGDTMELGMWVTGEESESLYELHQKTIEEAFDRISKGWKRSKTLWLLKHPMDDRVPEVPDHIQGIEVRLLVAESTLLGREVQSPKGSFIANLEKKDLDRLRRITRKNRTLSDEQCDEIIEILGPESALETLRHGLH